MNSTDSYIRLEGIRLDFGKRQVFESLNCAFPRGRISVILGGSGGGKSTLLRLIGGLLHPKRGAVIVDGQDVAQLTYRQLSTIRQKMGMMFQGGALLDSYTIFENVALPLRETRKMSDAQINSAVREILDAVGVRDSEELLPRQLSGGMLRRVALARAMIRKPELLLCDEPFSGLDPVSLRQIEGLLVKINQQFGMTIVMVSHDLPSTLRMAAHIVLLLRGQAIEGSPQDLLATTNPDAAEFVRDGIELRPQSSVSA